MFQADMASFDLPRRDYTVAVCAVSTLFMLPGPEPQLGCVKSAARHLRPEGQLFIEAFRPDPDRFDADGRRIEHRPTIDGLAHTVRRSTSPRVSASVYRQSRAPQVTRHGSDTGRE